MSIPFWRCTNYTGSVRCEAIADVLLLAPDGKPVPGCRLCLPHAKLIHNEYQTKLNECWSTQDITPKG